MARRRNLPGHHCQHEPIGFGSPDPGCPFQSSTPTMREGWLMRCTRLTIVALATIAWSSIGMTPTTAAPVNSGYTTYPATCPEDAAPDAQAGCVCTQAGFEYDKAANRCIDRSPPECRGAKPAETTGSTSNSLTWSTPPAGAGRTNPPAAGYQWGQYDFRTCSSAPANGATGKFQKVSPSGRRPPSGTRQ